MRPARGPAVPLCRWLPVLTLLVAVAAAGCTSSSGSAGFLNADLGGCDGGCPCVVDNQCSLKLPRCDKASGACVECLSDFDNCGVLKKCVNRVCLTKCTKDADCPQGEGALTCCSGVCVDPLRDASNCGSCGKPCPTPPGGAAGCSAGQCGVGRCDPGRGDCNHDPADGCEVTLAEDPRHCGMCGHACTAGPHQQNGCAAGACMPSCSPGFLHCSQDPADGCEVDKLTDPQNCGACGVRCLQRANATPGCSAGQCGIGSCAAGFGDCNQVVDDGCETSLTGVKDCGRCGNACPTPANASPGCNAGQCGIAGCNSGFGDCDGASFDGCEIDLRSDALNCGRCANLCSLPNATPMCLNSACAIAACAPGYTNCNNQALDGCEVNTNGDPRNCGGCNVVCPVNAPACVAGVCKANSYLPVGPQQNVQAATVTNGGWSECYRDVYSNAATTLASILNRCNGSRLMLACAQVGSNTLTLLAQAPRADVIFPVVGNVPHNANGTGWYYDTQTSWGFALQGDLVTRNSCDVEAGSTHLCWHTSGGLINGGYRCGSTTALNGSAAWNRIIYQLP